MAHRFILWTLSVIALFGCQATSRFEAFHEAVRGKTDIVVYQGLPHPVVEKEAYRRDKEKPHQTWLDQALRNTPTLLSPEDVKTLAVLLSESSALEPWSGEKKCGGFHADWALEFVDQGKSWRALICFTCGELKLVGDEPVLSDMTPLTKSELERVLAPYRTARTE